MVRLRLLVARRLPPVNTLCAHVHDKPVSVVLLCCTVDFVHVYSSRQREATAAEQLAGNRLTGQAQGMWGAEAEVFKGGITRCATTQV